MDDEDYHRTIVHSAARSGKRAVVDAVLATIEDKLDLDEVSCWRERNKVRRAMTALYHDRRRRIFFKLFAVVSAHSRHCLTEVHREEVSNIVCGKLQTFAASIVLRKAYLLWRIY